MVGFLSRNNFSFLYFIQIVRLFMRIFSSLYVFFFSFQNQWKIAREKKMSHILSWRKWRIRRKWKGDDSSSDEKPSFYGIGCVRRQKRAPAPKWIVAKPLLIQLCWKSVRVHIMQLYLTRISNEAFASFLYHLPSFILFLVSLFHIRFFYSLTPSYSLFSLFLSLVYFVINNCSFHILSIESTRG